MMEDQNSRYSPMLIFAVGDQAAGNMFQLWASIEGIPFKVLKGCWDGQAEESYLVPAEHWEALADWIKDQEAVLVLGAIDTRTGKRPVAVRYAGDHWHNGDMWWTRVTAAEAKTHPGWTFDPVTDTYWLVLNTGGEAVNLASHDHEPAAQTITASTIAA